MQKDYISMIEIINKHINDFNNFLDPKFNITLLNLNDINVNEYFPNLVKTTWLDLRFPNAEKKGVYFIVGYDSKDISKKSMYIGKASFSSSIGKRLYAHLNKDKNNDFYTMYDLNGNIHNLEYVFSLDLETLGLSIFCSSLEEYLIQNAKNEVYLLNGTGNY